MTFKPLYQFVLPALNNAGDRNYDTQRWQFEKEAATIAGGFTYLGLQAGGWVNDGKVQREPVHIYQVAALSTEADLLTTTLFKLYPDQAAFMVAEIGLANIIDAGPRVNAANDNEQRKIVAQK